MKYFLMRASVEYSLSVFLLVLSLLAATGCERRLSSIEYLERGILLAQRAHYAEAMENFNRSLSMEPGNPDVFYERAVVHAELGRNDLALKDYGEAIRLDPMFEQAYTNRGLLLASMDLFEDAIKDFSRIIELTPDSVAAFEDRAFAFHELNEDERALADLSRAIEIVPSAQALFVRGSIYASNQRDEDAIVDFTGAINENADFAKAYLGRALALARIGQIDEAQNDLAHAVVIDSEIVSDDVLEALQKIGAVEQEIDFEAAASALEQMGWEVARENGSVLPFVISNAERGESRVVCVARRSEDDQVIELPGDCCAEVLRESRAKALLLAIDRPGEEISWQLIDNWNLTSSEMESVRVRVDVSDPRPEMPVATLPTTFRSASR